METVKRILIREGKKFYVKDIGKDFHTQFGCIKAKDLSKKKGKVVTNTKEEMYIFEPSFIDVYKKIKRMPQIITLKDLGIIIAETGINSKSKIVDAGAGSGALACFLANIAQVVSYEIRKDFLKVAEYNKKLLRLKNLKLKNKDVYQGISEREVDLITLDLPEPWKVLKNADKALKVGGFIVSYSPTVPQVMDFVNEVEKNKKLVHVKTVELIKREWDIKDRVVRPKTSYINHTGFLTFVRKIS